MHPIKKAGLVGNKARGFFLLSVVRYCKVLVQTMADFIVELKVEGYGGEIDPVNFNYLEKPS